MKKKKDVDMAELYHGYLSCRKRKRNTRQEQEFSIHITTNLTGLRNELLYRTYKPMPVRSFLIDKPVLREIFAPEFRDRVDQHYIAERLEPLFEKEFINDCYSCRKGRGTLFGIRRLKRFIAQCSANYTRDCYVLMCDIKGYFMSIDRAGLWQRLHDFIVRKYQAEDMDALLWQVHTFLFTSPLNNTVIRGPRKRWKELPDNKSVFHCCGAPKPDEFQGTYTEEMDVLQKGLTIGALPAQMFGNFYLTPFDHFCKHTQGLRFYGRYVDDFFVVHTDKEYLKRLVRILDGYLMGMGLELNPNKVRIVHYSQGIPFLGAYIKGKTILPGRRIQGGFRHLLQVVRHLPSALKHQKVIEKFVCRINSYLGMMRHFNARMYIRRMLNKCRRMAFFFRVNESMTKVKSIRKIMEERHFHVLRLSLRKWHGQFRKGTVRKRFLSKKELYRSVYYRNFKIYPV